MRAEQELLKEAKTVLYAEYIMGNIEDDSFYVGIDKINKMEECFV